MMSQLKMTIFVAEPFPNELPRAAGKGSRTGDLNLGPNPGLGQRNPRRKFMFLCWVKTQEDNMKFIGNSMNKYMGYGN